MNAHYRLRPWFSSRWLDKRLLSSNLNAIDYLTDNPSLIDWVNLSRNPNAIRLIECYPNQIHWTNLSENPNAIHLIESNLTKISWLKLSINPNAIHLLEANLDKICWNFLSMNTEAIHILESNPHRICWNRLMSNHNALHLIERYLGWCPDTCSITHSDRLESNTSYINLASNKNAIHLIKWFILNVIDDRSRIHRFDSYAFWVRVFINPNAIDLIKDRVEWDPETKTMKYSNKINWHLVSLNPNIIPLYELLRVAAPNQKLFNQLINPIALLYSNVASIPFNQPEGSDQNLIETMHARVLSARQELFELWAPKTQLHKELIEYIYNPQRIQARIESGDNIDEIFRELG